MHHHGADHTRREITLIGDGDAKAFAALAPDQPIILKLPNAFTHRRPVDAELFAEQAGRWQLIRGVERAAQDHASQLTRNDLIGRWNVELFKLQAHAVVPGRRCSLRLKHGTPVKRPARRAARLDPSGLQSPSVIPEISCRY